MEHLLQIIEGLIKTYGIWIVYLVVFAESGIFFMFFLPGDSLLFISGVLASQGILPIWPLALGSGIFGMVGNQIGYITGKYFGDKLFITNDSPFFKKDYIKKAENYYKKHGPLTIVMCRFVPIVRTFGPIVAGMAHMHYPTFLKYNVLGGILWGVGITLLGYGLGNAIPKEMVEKYLVLITFIIVAISFLPTVIEYIKHKKGDNKLTQTDELRID